MAGHLSGDFTLKKKGTPAYRKQTKLCKHLNKCGIFSYLIPSSPFLLPAVSLPLSFSPSIFHILSKSLLLSLTESPDSSGRGGALPQPHASSDLSSCLFFTLCLSFFPLHLSLPLFPQQRYISKLFLE